MSGIPNHFLDTEKSIFNKQFKFALDFDMAHRRGGGHLHRRRGAPIGIALVHHFGKQGAGVGLRRSREFTVEDCYSLSRCLRSPLSLKRYAGAGWGKRLGVVRGLTISAKHMPPCLWNNDESGMCAGGTTAFYENFGVSQAQNSKAPRNLVTAAARHNVKHANL